jgi:predicted ATP-grasp superfamily ATP-dependent carboligase
MTRVFVYEYTCAAPPDLLKAGGAVSLSAEGEAMLRAILADLQNVPGVDAITIRHEADEEQAFRDAARRAGWSLIIAPEFNRILETRCRWVLEAGGRLLGPSPDAVALCGDKLETCRWLQRRGIATPPTVLAGEAFAGTPSTGWVVKPRFGAGSQDTFLIQAPGEFDRKRFSGDMIVQPYVPGLAASIALLVGKERTIFLPPAEQRVNIANQRFQYLGGRVPLSPPLTRRAEELGAEVAGCMSGLLGYIGVDIVLGDDGRDWVIEINPRLTTSYVGLRALSKTNLAEVMLCLAERREPPVIDRRSAAVEFDSEGNTRLVVES